MTRPLSRPLRLGTRGSPLALAQARLVATALRIAHDWDEEAIEIIPITTSGDVVQDRPLAEVGGKALWTKELDRALHNGRTDLSVHSMKDVETIRPDSLVIAAMLPRADARDRLIGADSLAVLADGARLGTSSPRREAQVRARRPDLQVMLLRGNVQTRLAKLERNEVDATLLAAAGLDRLGMQAVGTPVDDMLPAPSQGAVGIETLADNDAMLALLAPIDHRATHDCVDLERAFLLGAGGDCHSALAAHAAPDGDSVLLKAEILSPDGREVVAGEIFCAAGDRARASALAHDLLAQASPALRARFAA
ncbi:hydroxymethylbilane synthase [Sphingosinicella sp. YJ22]|uniref:hydroxymethylbilane synthase n=1 Tax=Sphingosinicella sp. YJ22 TaxID=1104780 RepID=UPI00140D8D46|nr:hydroxymethylbilane synthase [Sphingosinicella sp. YJ22]